MPDAYLGPKFCVAAFEVLLEDDADFVAGGNKFRGFGLALSFGIHLSLVYTSSAGNPL